MIQMLARAVGMAFCAMTLAQLVRRRSSPHRAVDAGLGLAGLALSRSWEGARVYLIGAAVTSAAIGLTGVGEGAPQRRIAPHGRIHQTVHFMLAFLSFQSWIVNVEDRDKTGYDSPTPPA